MRIKNSRSLGEFVIYLLLLLAIAPAWNSKVLAEEFPSANFGGKGGTRNYNLDCGANGIMTGAMASSSNVISNYIEQLVVICRTVNPSTGTLGDKYTRGPSGGIGGHKDAIERCQNGQVVTRLNVSHKDFIVHFVLRCESWLPDVLQPLQTPDRVNTLELGQICIFGCKKYRQDFRCPGFRVAKALRGRSGTHIDSLQMVCDDWDK